MPELNRIEGTDLQAVWAPEFSLLYHLLFIESIPYLPLPFLVFCWLYKSYIVLCLVCLLCLQLLTKLFGYCIHLELNGYLVALPQTLPFLIQKLMICLILDRLWCLWQDCHILPLIFLILASYQCFRGGLVTSFLLGGLILFTLLWLPNCIPVCVCVAW